MARMRSEYRGDPIERPYAWTHYPPSMDLPPDDFYGVFILEKTGPDGLTVLLRVFQDFGLTVKCDSESLTDSLVFLQKQAVRKCVR